MTDYQGANGRTATVEDNRGTRTVTSETGNDRVASDQDPVTGTTSYTYRLTGERATMTLPNDGGTWTYDYGDRCVPTSDDPNSVSLKLLKITDDQGRMVEYATDSTGAVYDTFFNQSFDNNGAVVSYCRATVTCQPAAKPTYSNAHLGRVTRVTEAGRMASGLAAAPA